MAATNPVSNLVQFRLQSQYNWDNYFEGTFNVVAAEVQSGQGAQGFWFENEKGVRVHIRAAGQDVTVRLQGGGSTVRLVQ
jgi:hypothetical protein